MKKLRKTYARAIYLYEQTFGSKDPEYRYLVRPSNGGVVVIVAFLTTRGVFVIKDQALVHSNRVYKSGELISDFNKYDDERVD